MRQAIALVAVYCGSSPGAVADAPLDAGGEVLGVTTRALDAHGISHQGVTRLEVLPDTHARKLRIADDADRLLDALQAWEAVHVPKWVDRG